MKASKDCSVPGASARKAHSHTTATRQCCSSNFWIAASSRCAFRAIFPAQNSVRVFGTRNRAHPVWPCQKHPCTNTTTFQRGNTTSGRPGRSFRNKRNRKPAECRYRRTSNSGWVSRPRIPDIIRERVSGLILSGIASTHSPVRNNFPRHKKMAQIQNKQFHVEL